MIRVIQALLPMICYCLPVTTFTESNCTDIMWPVKKFIVPKLNLNKKFPYVLLFALIEYGRRNVLNLYCDQGISYIDT